MGGDQRLDPRMNGKRFKEQDKEMMGREELAREQTRREAKELVKRLAETYTQLTNLMEQNPELAETMEAEDRSRVKAFQEKLRQNLRRANDAPRCRWVKQDGRTCGSPQMQSHIYCYAHRQMMESRALALRLPALEDANAIQIALMRVQKSLIDDTISMKKAGLLLYSLQLAMTNVGQTTFGQAGDDELVTNTVEEEEALSDQQIPNPLTTEDTHSTPFGESQDGSGQAAEHGGEAGDGKLDRVTPKPFPRSGRERAWRKLPEAALKSDNLSGSFDAPSCPEGTRACSG